ncbi:2-hydroxyacyl-CoA dehydratase family protein [Chloroflexota bacterium]
MKTIGITTTVPIEILLSAGYQPVDMNNIFINDADPEHLVNIAERDGFPLNCCSWIKGIYGSCLEYGIDTVLCVTNGDCSNTGMLMEVLELKGIKTIPFAFPEKPSPKQVQLVLEVLAEIMGTTMAAAGKVRDNLKLCRDLAGEMDWLTWKEGVVSGLENHMWLVSASDFNGDPAEYRRELEELMIICRKRQPYPAGYLRLAYIGVPPVYAREFYPHLEKHGSRVVFNEIQRQFAMPRPGESFAEQYANYTYPYSTKERLKDITGEIKRRRVDGIIHYVQAFCHRGIGDIIFREAIDLPILTLEGNDDFYLNQHIKTRVEAFLDMLERRQQSSKYNQRILAKNN